jgi:hypothetical protein
VALDEFRVGGEPGEDPHLKVQPTIHYVGNSDLLGCSEGVKVGDAGVCGIQAEGMREGSGECLGSRVNLAWRAILRTWLWQLQR